MTGKETRPMPGTRMETGAQPQPADDRGLALSYAHTLSWLSMLVVLLVSLGLSFIISNQARQVLMERQEGFALLLAQNLNNQIFQRFAVPTIVAYGHISLRQEEQHQRLDGVVRSVIEGLPVSRLRLYDFARIVSYSTDASEIGRKGIAPLNIGDSFLGELQKPEIIAGIKAWQVPFEWPLKPGTFTLRVLYPLRGDAYNTGSSPVLGVLELTQDITQDYAQVLLFQAAIVVMCLLSSVIIFTLLIFFIHRAERILSLRMQKNMQLEKKLQDNERLAGMGRVVASIAHEIRNPLGIIRSTAELLQRRASTAQDKGTTRLLQAIYDESLRLSQTVNDFLDYARPRKPKEDPVEVDLVIRQILAFVEGDFARDNIVVEKSLVGGLWVLGDKDLLYRALYNVFVNGRQAMKENGTLRIHAFSRAGEVVVEVGDTGPGFAPELMDKLFEPFFTTKDAGTGLGLPIVRSIIESHGGSVHIANVPEGGAMVTVLLPKAPQGTPGGQEKSLPQDQGPSRGNGQFQEAKSGAPASTSASHGTLAADAPRVTQSASLAGTAAGPSAGSSAAP